MVSPSVEVIILNWNGKTYLEECLTSIQNNTNYDNYEITVVDNGSDDGSRELIKQKFPETNLIENQKNLGFAIGNNIGIKQTEADYYLLLNNDTEVEDDWLTRLVETSEEKNAGIIGPKLIYPDRKIQSAGIKLPELENYRQGQASEQVQGVSQEDGVLGAAFMIDSNVVETIGYLDEIFTPANHEESDYCSRAHEAGFKILLDADSTVIHKEGKTKEAQPTKLEHYYGHKNYLKYNFMNTPISRFSEPLWRECKNLVASLIGYSHHSLLIFIKMYAEFFKDVGNMLTKRRDREKFIPSYYCEGIKDYSKRYE